MNYHTFITVVYTRLSKLKFLILGIGVLAALCCFIYTKTIPKVYSSRATVFPLNASNDNAGAASALTSLLGLSETPKSFIQEASINIVDLALSRNTREAVALETIPTLGNKSVAVLVIEEYNKRKPFYKSTINIPESKEMLAAVGANLLKDHFFAKINKNGILEINFNTTSEALVGPVSYIFVDKISEFYKELKIKKAKRDYDFMCEKVDSLELVLASYDKSAIGMSNTTLFVAPDKLQFQLPKQNLSNEKSRVMRQRDMSAENKEEALWRLQKETPIIAMLDKPDAPYDTYKPSAMLYSAIGFMISIILAVMTLIFVPLYRFIKFEIRKSVFETPNSSIDFTSE